jgi:hypothetical protein
MARAILGSRGTPWKLQSALGTLPAQAFKPYRAGKAWRTIGSMESTARDSEYQQLDLPGDFAVPLNVSPGSAPHKPGRAAAQDYVQVRLRGLGDRLRAQAQRQQTTLSALVRQGLVLLLEDPPAGDEPAVATPTQRTARDTVRLNLHMPRADAASLDTRARAAGMFPGEYVSSLLKGVALAPLPADHASAVKALLTSTDRLAVLSADLNAFMRVVGRASVAELEPYRASITSLTKDVRDHLAVSSALVAELLPARRQPR